MVEVGDKVIVAPLDGQKDKMAIITGPAGAGAVLNEGDYNTWTLEWINAPSNGISGEDSIEVLIDEKNGKLNITWEDESYKNRFGTYNINDFSAIYESPLGSHYTDSYTNLSYKKNMHTGMVYFHGGATSKSIQTYLLLLRNDEYTLEVWQGGASALWSTNTRTDSGYASSKSHVGGISLTGKYILVVIHETVSPWGKYLMLYKGSYV